MGHYMNFTGGGLLAAGTSAMGHEAHVCGLDAITTYFYKVGGPGNASVALDSDQRVATFEIELADARFANRGDFATDLMLAGATAVQVGTAHYRTPDVVPRLVDELRERLAAAGRRRVTEQIGTLKAN